MPSIEDAWRSLTGFLRRRSESDASGNPQGFFRNVSVLAGGTAVGQAVSILTVPILCRIYSVEAFGLFQVYVSLMGFAVVAVAWRYEMAILLPEDPRTAACVVILCLALVLGTSSALALFLWGGGAAGLLPHSFERLGKHVWWMPLSMAGAGFYLSVSHWAMRERSYVQIATTRLAQSLAQSVTQIVLGAIANFGLAGLVVGDIFGRGTGAISLTRSAWKTSRGLFTLVHWRDMWAVAVRYRQFPLISSGSSLINTAGFALPSLMLDSHCGAQVLGWFALGDRVMGVPSTLVGAAISQVYMSEASRLARSDVAGLRRLFLGLPKRLLFFGVAPYALVVLFGPPLFEFVFGAAWRETGYYARLLAEMNCAIFLFWPLTSTLSLLERQSCQLAWDVGRMVATVGCLELAFTLKGTPAQAITFYGLARMVASATHFGLCLLTIGQLKKRLGCCHPARPEYCSARRQRAALFFLKVTWGS